MRKEVKIGLLAIITAIISIWGFKFISGKKLLSGDKTFYTIVDDAKELNTATKVLINGFQVGSVTMIEPEASNVKNIKVGFQVNKSVAIPDYTIVQIKVESPLGGKELNLVFDKYCDGSNCAKEGSFLESRTLGLFSSIISQDEMQPQISQLTEKLDSTWRNIGDPNSQAPIDRTVSDLSITMKNMAETTEKFAVLMDRSSKNIETTMANMAVLTDALVSSNVKLSAILNDVGTITADLSKISLSSTVDKSNSTLDQASQSLKALENTMTEATTLVKDLNGAVANIESNDGTLGLLLNDKDLYNNLEASTQNMTLLLQDIRLNPRRYFKLFGRKSSDYEFPEDDPAKGQ